MNTRATQAYMQTNVGTADQGRLLLMLYDGALKFLQQAREKMLEKDYAAKGILISKVIDIAATHHLTDSLNLHAVHVDFPPEIQRDTIDRLGRKIYGQMLVTFKNRIYSVINYYKPSFLIDDFGNFDSGSGIFFEGDMAIQRIGNMLPYNYRPPTR